MSAPWAGSSNALDLLLLVPIVLCCAGLLAVLVRSFQGPSARAWGLLAAMAPVVLVGGVLRGRWIETRTAWEDEGLTMVRVAGYRTGQIIPTIRRGTWLAALTKYARPLPGTLSEFLLHPSRHNPDVHPPLYFMAARVWSRVFGPGLGSLRLFSAALGLLAVGCAGFLALELSGSLRAGVFAATAIAVSPLQVLESQDARMYTLAGALAFATTLCLVRFLRAGGESWVRAYAGFVGLGCLTHGLFPLLAVGQLASLAWLRLGRAQGRASQAMLAGAAGLACGVPWLLLGVARRGHSGLDWLLSRPDVAEWAKDLAAGLAMNVVSLPPEWFAAALAVAVILVALAEIGRRRSAWGAVLAVPALAWILVLAAVDAWGGGQFASQPRYLLVPAGLALVLAAVAVDSFVARTRIAGLLYAAVLAVSASSAIRDSRAERLWFRSTGLLPGMTRALAATAEPRLFVPRREAARSADLVALADAATIPVYVFGQSAAPLPAGTYVWHRGPVAERLAAPLDGILEPVEPPLYRLRRDDSVGVHP